MSWIVLVFNNVKKLVELCCIFEGVGIEVEIVGLLEVSDVLVLEEIGRIFVENVFIKVCVVVYEIGLFVLVDDFGFEVDVFNWMFGICLVCWLGFYVNDECNF